MLKTALVLIHASGRLGCDCMHDDEERVRIPITEVFDLRAVEPREVAAVVEAISKKRPGSASILCASFTVAASVSSGGLVRAVLARTPFVLSYRDAPPEAGG